MEKILKQVDEYSSNALKAVGGKANANNCFYCKEGKK
jgi:hypothetical protein